MFRAFKSELHRLHQGSDSNDRKRVLVGKTPIRSERKSIEKVCSMTTHNIRLLINLSLKRILQTYRPFWYLLVTASTYFKDQIHVRSVQKLTIYNINLRATHTSGNFKGISVIFPRTLICLSNATWTTSSVCKPSKCETTDRISLSFSVSWHFSPSMSCGH